MKEPPNARTDAFSNLPVSPASYRRWCAGWAVGHALFAGGGGAVVVVVGWGGVRGRAAGDCDYALYQRDGRVAERAAALRCGLCQPFADGRSRVYQAVQSVDARSCLQGRDRRLE